MALSVRKDYAAAGPMQTPGSLDLHRWYLVEGLGRTVEQVAKTETSIKREVSADDIQASIDYVSEYQRRNDGSLLRAKTNEIMLSRLDKIGKTIDRALDAEKVVFVNRETGKVTKVPDFATQLKAVAESRNYIESVQPKTPFLVQNQQFNNGMPMSGSAGGASFEAILRKKRAEHGLLNSGGEIVDAEVTPEEELADEFKDLGGEDEGDDDE